MKGTALDAPAEKLDDQEQRFVSVIREHGWFHTHVFGDEEGPGFDYTTGFQIGLGHPEIITFDMNKDVASTVLWDLYRSIGMGQEPAIGEPLHELTVLPLMLLPVSVDHYRDYLGWNRWFYGGDHFTCLQLVWTDREGLFPWQAGFDAGRFGARQPDLTAGNWAGHPAS